MKSIPYRIKGIRTIQFALFPENFVNGKGVEINSSFTFGHTPGLESVRCISSFTFLQDDKILLIAEIHTMFDISPEGREQLKEIKKIPVDFLRYMATIATGTARGIIHAKSEGTVLNSIILPPINLIETIKEDLQLKI